MRCFAKQDCREIVLRLARDFWAKNGSDLTRRTGEADQDFIRRHLFNSTGRVSAQLDLHYEFLGRLADSLIESLEEGYTHLSPAECRPQLLEVIDGAFAELAGKVPKWLSESLLVDAKLHDSFLDSVVHKCDKVKTNIANACALWEERWKEQKRQRKWYRDPRWVAIAVSILVLVIGSFVAPLVLRKITAKADLGKVRRDSPLDPNTGRTALYVRTKAKIDERTEYLVREKVQRWLFIGREPGSKATLILHDGNPYAYHGLEFSDSVRDFFWSDRFIEPFLEDTMREVFDEVGKECQSNGINSRAALKEAGWLLDGLVRRVYNEMADVDQRLRGKGFPKTVKKEDVTSRIERMTKRVQEHLKGATTLYSDIHP